MILPLLMLTLIISKVKWLTALSYDTTTTMIVSWRKITMQTYSESIIVHWKIIQNKQKITIVMIVFSYETTTADINADNF